MRRLLIVTPHFPPINAPDHHRVRTSLRFYREFGWDPRVLTVSPDSQEGYRDDRLMATVPDDVPVVRSGAVPTWLTRRVGFGDVALRAFASLYRAGARLIRSEQIDLVFISTTAFPVMALGRLWKMRYGVPYVLDMQDPWVSDYRGDVGRARTLKQRLAATLHETLEPFTMRSVDGLVAVSPHYLETLRGRYRWIDAAACATVPFGYSDADMAIARDVRLPEGVLDRQAGTRHGVYVGAGGAAMRTAARILFRAVRQLAEHGELPGVRFHFVGTDYAPAGRERETIRPEAVAEGVDPFVREIPQRVPYFVALRLLLESDFLILLGSDDSQYNPSKLATWLRTRRPLIAIVHEESPAVALLRAAGVSSLVTFGNGTSLQPAVERVRWVLRDVISRPDEHVATNDKAVEPYSARELSRRQCAAFEAALHAPAPLPQTISCHE